MNQPQYNMRKKNIMGRPAYTGDLRIYDAVTHRNRYKEPTRIAGNIADYNIIDSDVEVITMTTGEVYRRLICCSSTSPFGWHLVPNIILKPSGACNGKATG